MLVRISQDGWFGGSACSLILQQFVRRHIQSFLPTTFAQFYSLSLIVPLSTPIIQKYSNFLSLLTEYDIIMNNRSRSEIIMSRASFSFHEQEEGLSEEEKIKNKLFKKFKSLYSQQEMNDVINLFIEELFTFLEVEKGQKDIEDVDLNMVNVEELKTIIDRCKEQLAKKKLKLQQEERLPIIQEQPMINKRESMPSEIFFDIPHEKVSYINGAWDYEFKTEGVNCNQRKFFNKDLIKASVEVSNSIVRTERSYLLFLKKTLLIKISSKYKNSMREVLRSVDDFSFYYGILGKTYPHSMIPQLNIVGSDISNAEKFIKAVLEDEDLFDNEFTFYFLTEESEEKYADHKRDNQQRCVKTMDQFVNSSGLIAVDVSKEAEEAKRGIHAMIAVFTMKFTQLETIIKAILAYDNSLVEKYSLNEITEDIHTFLDEIIGIMNPHKNNAYFNLTNFVNLVDSFKKIVDMTGECFHSCKPALSGFSSSFLTQAISNSQLFNLYRSQMMKLANVYQERRMIFLQDLSKKMQVPIAQLDLTETSQECDWIDHETVWYGHLNASLIKTFSNFIKKQAEALNAAIKPVFIQLREKNQRQKRNLDLISQYLRE